MRRFQRCADLGSDWHDQDRSDRVRDAGGDDEADGAEQGENRPEIEAVDRALEHDVADESEKRAKMRTHTSLSSPDDKTARPSAMPPMASATIAHGMLSQSCCEGQTAAIQERRTLASMPVPYRSTIGTSAITPMSPCAVS